MLGKGEIRMGMGVCMRVDLLRLLLGMLVGVVRGIESEGGVDWDGGMGYGCVLSGHGLEEEVVCERHVNASRATYIEEWLRGDRSWNESGDLPTLSLSRHNTDVLSRRPAASTLLSSTHPAVGFALSAATKSHDYLRERYCSLCKREYTILVTHISTRRTQLAQRRNRIVSP